MIWHKGKGPAALALLVSTTAGTQSQAHTSADLDAAIIRDESARLEARVARARAALMLTFDRMMQDGAASKGTVAQWYNWPNWNNWYNQWRNY